MVQKCGRDLICRRCRSCSGGFVVHGVYKYLQLSSLRPLWPEARGQLHVNESEERANKGEWARSQDEVQKHVMWLCNSWDRLVSPPLPWLPLQSHPGWQSALKGRPIKRDVFGGHFARQPSVKPCLKNLQKTFVN